MSDLPDREYVHAYYYGFDLTGVEPIDRILRLLAQAGRAYHSTEFWNESPCDDEDGPSYVDRIQTAANDAAMLWGVVDE